LVIREVKDLVVPQVDKVMQHKDLRVLQVIQHQVLRGQKDQQVRLVIKAQLHLQDQRESRDQRVIRVLRVQLVTHHKDLRGHKVIPHKVTPALVEMVDLRVMLEIRHKDLLGLQGQVDQVVIKDLQEIRELKDQKVQLHRQDLQDLQVLEETKDR
jgi:hypothetical protein